jgi:hypothetical protein
VSFVLFKTPSLPRASILGSSTKPRSPVTCELPTRKPSYTESTVISANLTRQVHRARARLERRRQVAQLKYPDPPGRNPSRALAPPPTTACTPFTTRHGITRTALTRQAYRFCTLAGRTHTYTLSAAIHARTPWVVARSRSSPSRTTATGG